LVTRKFSGWLLLLCQNIKGSQKKYEPRGFYNNISDIETLFAKKKLADTLIGSFEKTSKKSLVPVISSWLYFGKSFE